METCICTQIAQHIENKPEDQIAQQIENKPEDQIAQPSEDNIEAKTKNHAPADSSQIPNNELVVCIITAYYEIMVSILKKLGAVAITYKDKTMYSVKINIDRGNFITLCFKIIHSVFYKNVESEISNATLFLIAGDSSDQFDSYNMSLLASYLNEKPNSRVKFINLSLLNMKSSNFAINENELEDKNTFQYVFVKWAQRQNDLYRASMRFKCAIDELYSTQKLSVLCRNDLFVSIVEGNAKDYFEQCVQGLIPDITESAKFE